VQGDDLETLRGEIAALRTALAWSPQRRCREPGCVPSGRAWPPYSLGVAGRKLAADGAPVLERDPRIVEVVVDQRVQRDLHEHLEVEFAEQLKCIACTLGVGVTVADRLDERMQVAGLRERVDEVGGPLLVRRGPVGEAMRPDAGRCRNRPSPHAARVLRR
jgi:hypothetical protein